MKPMDSDIALQFGGLSPMERRYLSQWHHAARAVGIDAIEDLSQRPWPCSVEGAVIGVYVEGNEAAAWLLVKHNGRWAVACCADNSVSPSVESLADALTRLYEPNSSDFIRQA